MNGAQDMIEDDAATFIGSQVMDMADRLRPIDKAAPGSRATYAFEMDGITYEITLKVRHD